MWYLFLIRELCASVRNFYGMNRFAVHQTHTIAAAFRFVEQSEKKKKIEFDLEPKSKETKNNNTINKTHKLMHFSQ